MTAPAISKGQIKAIHTLKSRAGMDDDTYRDFLERETGHRSSKKLTNGQAIGIIDGLKKLSKPAQGAPRKRGLPGPYAPKLQALWISAWHLGLTRNNRDSALLAFVKRQTGIDHTRWLREPAEAARAIEGLKSWIARAANVRWDEFDDPKCCVLAAQHRLLGEPWPDTLPEDLNALMQELGAELRDRAERSKRYGDE
ncbi:hypothetical protein AUC70_11830 [Methyloceanibacter stevinii]|uniref:GemA protein n=1 Tax=Methyloceanibacter stevinii TaxID=1774970 RepID=A0A1E3VJ52_9HYPH|nr:regulatory protein GemA [Methyloceanibacter stevinii]ODR93545.1 hypothetical protein AUC70_11830 [Methyloceanibacter stevinii]